MYCQYIVLSLISISYYRSKSLVKVEEEKENITEEQFVKLLNMIESVDIICMYLHNFIPMMLTNITLF